MIDWKQHEERLRELVQDVEATDQTIADELGMEIGESLTAEQVRSARRRLGIEKAGPGRPAFNGLSGMSKALEGSIITDYVSMGSNLTQREVARKHGLSLKEVQVFLKERGITKASLPFTPLDLETREEAELVTEALTLKEQRIGRKIEAGYVAKLERDHRQLLEERMSQDRIIEAAKEIAASVKSRAPGVLVFEKTKEKGDPWQAHVPTADEHVGSLVWEHEAFGDDYDTKIACARLVRHAQLAAEWIQSQPGECTMIHRSFLGDLFHALLGGTERGTRLDQDTRAGKVWYLLLEALRESVATLAQTGVPVTVRGVKGNHDGQFEFLAAMYTLKMIFEGNDKVNVVTTPGRYEAFLVNKTAHVLDHGTGYQSVAAERTRRGADMVARQLGITSVADQIITYVGHNHSYEAEFGQHTVIRLPAFCESDEYETSIRYYHEPQAQLFRLNREGKIDTVKRLYRDDIEG